MFRKPNTGKKASLSQYGLLDMPDPDEEGLDLSDDDVDLEAELAAISGEIGGRPKRKPVAAPTENLDLLIAASLKDIPSDDEVSDTGDDEDPELLNELKELAMDDEATPPPVPTRSTRPAPPPPGTPTPANSTITLLQERIANYTQAEKNAKENGESSRARRFNRGLKTLNDLLKQAKAGKQINEDDIPLAATISKPKDPQPPPPDPVEPPPVDPESTPAEESHSEEPPSLPEPDYPPPSAPTEDQSLDPKIRDGLLFILKRKEEFKKAALEAKHAGDKPLALAHLKVLKQFDIVVDAYKSGQEMDLQELPTPEGIASELSSQQKTEDQHQTTPEPAPVAESTGLITASTVEEALKQRLEGFQKVEAKSKADGDMAKARRTGRILKQYQEAIRLHSMGKPLDLEELPPLAGFAPFPTDGSKPSPATPRTPAVAPSRYHKQIALLQQRQKQFKEAALKSKRAGDLDKAREYLRLARGFDSIIEAAKGGLIVDLNTLPLPPSQKDKLEHAFDVVSAEDCQPVPGEVTSPSSSDEGDVLSRLQQQLSSQLKLCVANRDHYRALGSVAETNRFEHLALTVKQDLDVVQVAKSLGQPLPKFHYENKNFAIVQCNTDLNENDLELTIVRGISYNVPNPREVDTYVKFEFPYPQESPVSDRTALVKDTNSPQYDAVFPLVIARKARLCLRVFKRHAIKLEVYSRGGWFSRDTLLGTASVKLAHLETHCTLHDAFPLMEGRRPAGGSLEVKLRVRTPLVQQQVDNTTHRWLVIDN